MRNLGDLNGILNLEKPSGVTSRDVVNLISRPLRKVKVGHAGTLDPLASGVLVVCVGSATRLIELVQRMPKTYRAVIRLGARSETLDADGRIEVVDDPQVSTEADVRSALATQVGTIDQVPPQFSALKVAGQRAYDLARAGQTVELASRPVRVDRVELVSYVWPRVEVVVDCGSGTYIRSIARDVGEALGVGGLIEVLVRTRIGPFSQSDALDPTGLAIDSILTRLRPSLEALGDLPRLSISSSQLFAIAQGKGLPALEVDGTPEADVEVGLIGPDGSLVALAEVEGSADRAAIIRPRRVFLSGQGR